jgi:hypothetical protein
LNNFNDKYIEEWFSPFIFKWIRYLSQKSVEWVEKAVEEDSFEPVESENGPQQSSSVIDIFSSLYGALEFVQGLDWSDDVQNVVFHKEFAKVQPLLIQIVYSTVEEYCDTLRGIKKSDFSIKKIIEGTNFLGGINAQTAKVTNYAQAYFGGKQLDAQNVDEEVFI